MKKFKVSVAVVKEDSLGKATDKYATMMTRAEVKEFRKEIEKFIKQDKYWSEKFELR